MKREHVLHINRASARRPIGKTSFTSSTAIVAIFTIVCCTLRCRRNGLLNDNSFGKVEAANPNHQCSLYLGRKSKLDRVSLFAGKDYMEGERLLDDMNDILVSIIDAQKNEWSPWHDYTFDPIDINHMDDSCDVAYLDNHFFHDIFIPGISSLVDCSSSSTISNIQAARNGNRICNTNSSICSSDYDQPDDTGEVSAGSFSTRRGYAYEAIRSVRAGEQLHPMCHGDEIDYDNASNENNGNVDSDQLLSLEWLQNNALCIDSLEVRPSKIPGIGRGAFSKKSFSIGETVAASPVIHINRPDLDIVEQRYNRNQFIPVIRDHGIEYGGKVTGKQLLLNYCYGTPDSNVLLLPYGSGVNLINHHRDRANVKIQWSSEVSTDEGKMELSSYDLSGEPVIAKNNDQLIIKYVATRDIQEGDEIYLDYGDEWIDAWEKHLQIQEQTQGTKEEHISATKYNALLQTEGNFYFKTITEQQKEPYPSNLRVACYIELITTNKSIIDQEDVLEWTEGNFTCLRPCDIEERVIINDEAFYTVVARAIRPYGSRCDLENMPEDGVRVGHIPQRAMTFQDKPYTKQQYRALAFRHEIGIPKDLYPKDWMIKDRHYNASEGDFIATPLKPGEIKPVLFRDDGAAVPNAYRIGLDKKIRLTLRKYVEEMGFFDIFRHLTAHGNSIKKARGFEQNMTLERDGVEWYVQATEKRFTSNMHWFSPYRNEAHEHYLQTLSIAGFDDVLESIGKHFNMNGIAAYQLSFMVVSHSLTGFAHTDFLDCEADVFNILVPLYLVNGSGPELDVNKQNYNPAFAPQTASKDQIGRYKYEYDVGIIIGDGVDHATSAADYRTQHDQFRVIASIYVADFNKTNANWVAEEITQVFPPKFDGDILLSWAGRHWKKTDKSVKLPKPSESHILNTGR